MTTTPSMADRIRALIAKDFNIPLERLTDDARLDELGVDSIGMAEVIFNLEDALELTLPEPVEQLDTFGDVVRFVEGVIAQQPLKAATAEPTPTPPAA